MRPAANDSHRGYGDRAAARSRAFGSVCLAGRLVLVGLMCLTSLGAVRMQASQLEYEIKAAMIYNFARFIEWPEESRSRPFVFGVVGEDPFGETLDRLMAGKDVSGREIRVERYRSVDRLGDCDVLFVSDSERPALPMILEKLDEQAVLTVGEMDGFARNGGVIGFRLDGNKVRFEINTEAARRSRLRISSKLLRLARVVGDRED